MKWISPLNTQINFSTSDKIKMKKDCLLCNWVEADKYFNRVQVWENDLWRVTTSLAAPVAGFSYLEPKRHIAYITDLDGDEAVSLGSTLAFVTHILRDVTNSKLVYVHIFGERVPHLHFNLAPHRDGDALRGGPGMLIDNANPIPVAELEITAEQFRQALGHIQK
jgi:diadenosine tetraphosphate (Ap4A) HIT family hydrolase